jgi:molybdopterin-binding protein
MLNILAVATAAVHLAITASPIRGTARRFRNRKGRFDSSFQARGAARGVGTPGYGARRGGRIRTMKISARNQLSGTIVTTKLGDVMAEIAVEVDAGQVVAAITRTSAEALELRTGDRVTVIIKSTEVMIGK